MDTSPAVSGRQRDGADATIYAERNSPATEAHHSEGRLARALAGFVLGAATWMLLARFGVPHIFGLSTSGGEIPFGLAGAAIGLTRFRRWLVWIPASLVMLLAIVSMTSAVVRPARSLIRADPVPATVDAVVVLSSGVTGDGFMRQQGSDRLRKGLELMRSGVAPNLIVTNERRRIGKGEVSTGSDQEKLIALAGIPTFISTGRVRSTHDEAVHVAEMGRRRGWNRIVLVTSPFHSRRACATFERAGLKVSCVPADSRDIAVRSLSEPDDRVAAFSMLIYELAGTIRYRQRGWL